MIIRHLVFSGICIFISSIATAHSSQIAVGAGLGNSVSQTTVVSVQQPPVNIVEHTTVYEQPEKDMTRVERRAYKAKVYAQYIDSLVQSRNYMFLPNSMQAFPKGMLRLVVANFFYFGFFVDRVEIHLPTERGITQYVETINFDSQTIRDYQALRMQWGWSVSFNILDGQALYEANLAVSTTTGETVLTLVTPTLAMRYVGWLWDKDEQGDRRR